MGCQNAGLATSSSVYMSILIRMCLHHSGSQKTTVQARNIGLLWDLPFLCSDFMASSVSPSNWQESKILQVATARYRKTFWGLLDENVSKPPFRRYCQDSYSHTRKGGKPKQGQKTLWGLQIPAELLQQNKEHSPKMYSARWVVGLGFSDFRTLSGSRFADQNYLDLKGSWRPVCRHFNTSLLVNLQQPQTLQVWRCDL